MASNPSPTELYLPPTFPYPIKIVSIDADSASVVQRGTRLLSYSFVHVPAQPHAQPESRFGTWDSAIEGQLTAWKVNVGDVITARKAKERPSVLVLEDCKHGMQIGGMCVVCGKDMTTADYIGFADSSRAHIQMTHSADGPTVSLEEAQRLEREIAEDLLKARKLSLIVDLDQTIVHATVDPTVGEWRTEGAAWKARQAHKKDGAADADPEDLCNPNWEALEDVAEFRLSAEAFGMGKGKSKMIEQGPTYFIKRRPGWQAFLEDVAGKYQMHVYTMGTRAYAEQVCALIDPTGRFFGGRLLSRDESGSLTQKSLQRLFPCDTSMVVIIDDRADVWEWSPNLIKVVPFDFFVGIGDINSAFLPKIDPLGPAAPTKAPTPAPPAGVPASGDPAQVTPSPLQPVSPTDAAREELAEKAMLTQNTIALEAQVEERPLAKKQEELLVATEGAKGAAAEGKGRDTTVSSAPEETKPKAALLKNDDIELQRLGMLLDEVHRRFFSVYDSLRGGPAPTSSRGRRNSMKHKLPYDVTLIIPRIRSEVLEGVHILFSSVIPLDTDPETADVWRMARMFGAKCSTELSTDVTHVVAAKRGTVKVDAARKRGGVKIVWLAWFTDCIALWRRQDEAAYLLDDAPAAPAAGVAAGTSATDPLQVPLSAEEATEEFEWDEPPGEGANGTLELEAINWNDINDEVDAAMNESDDSDEERGDARSVMSEDDWTDDTSSMKTNSASATPTRGRRKRLRSVTPSEGGVNGGAGDVPGSPLAKRKKVAADRTGASRLKEAVTADEIRGERAGAAVGKQLSVDANDGGSSQSLVSGSGLGTSGEVMQQQPDGEEEEDEAEEEVGDEDDEDDFLARELEEDWG
ncbi:hypothetical protein GGX14DRAFT_552029 [Mycena pura]|uniref:RNA polymerase II subunit A C-terminal domain phosphatase n=1 Tax=Mycena pura TaxID=153505 RepID=A0AAD6V3K5_9AGAR|nr:hypothetical protein GGX14DRAFT_552029 [Mycena pura]